MVPAAKTQSCVQSIKTGKHQKMAKLPLPSMGPGFHPKSVPLELIVMSQIQHYLVTAAPKRRKRSDLKENKPLLLKKYP